MKNMKKWGVGILFLLVSLGFFYQTVFFQKLPVPSDTLVGLYHPWRDLYASAYPRGIPFKNFLITDPIRQQIPWKKIVVDAWKSGSMPKLNPYTFTGVPIDANIQAAPFYPLNVLFLVLPFMVAWTLFIMLQPLLAVSFFYLFAKNLGASKTASVVGALAWGFGGFSIAWMTWGSMMHTALWLPLILLSIDRLIYAKRDRTKLRYWQVIFGISVLMTILGGHIQIALYSMVVSMCYGVWRMRLARKPSRTDRAMVKGIVIPLGIVFLLSSVQWVPFLRVLIQSGRLSTWENWKLAGWFLPWQHLIQFLVPDFFGNPATMNYWGVWNYGEFVGYIGIIPLILAVSALGVPGVPRFFVLTAGISFLFMLPNPLSALPFQLTLPVVSVLQPTRLMMVVSFSLSVLCVFGLDMMRTNMRRVWISTLCLGVSLLALWAFVVGVRFVSPDAALVGNLAVSQRNLVVPSLIFLGFVAWTIAVTKFFRRKGFGFAHAVLIALALFDLFRFGWKFTPFTPREYFFPETNVLRFLERQPKPFRVMSLDDRLLPPNVSAYYGIETIEGYDPIAPKLYEDFLVASERGKADLSRPTGFNRIYTAKNIDSPLLPFFNVRYVLSLEDIKRPFLREVMREGETRVYEYVDTLPRVYLSSDTQRVSESRDVLQTLFSRKLLYMGIYTKNIDVLNFPVSANETVTVTDYRTNQLTVHAQVMSERLLVILNRFDPRWSAKLMNGTKLDILPVNYLFMGVIVPRGTHDIILSYR